MTDSPGRLPVHRILVIKLRAVGDVLLSTIVTKNLRLAYPLAQIHYLTESPSVDVLKGNPFVDDVLVYDRKSMSGLGLIRAVRRGGYDVVIDLFGNPRTALLTRLSGAEQRVGFRFRGRTYAYNILAEPRGNRVHNTEFNLDALGALGVAIQDRSIYFSFDDDDARHVDSFLPPGFARGSFVVCINSGGGWYTKRWGLDRFAALADHLVAEYNARIVLSWGPGQLPEAEEIRKTMTREAFIPPATTLRQLGALLKRCSILVSNDSGPLHIAAAVGTPVLGIYGPTDPLLQGPYGDNHVVVRNEVLDCLGCNLTSCPIGHPCMLGLSVETVLQGV
ncbi:MAG TPA: glycosyltransferase family 9 protein, partial [Bacteroidota bacterium]